MKIIAIAAITAGGKTTIVNELLKVLPNSKSLHFDDYSFKGEVEDFYQWTLDGADYNVWNLEPLVNDICKLQNQGDCEILLLDYPMAYCNNQVAKYIDKAFFIDTPLDIAFARRIIRDFSTASGEEIREDVVMYIKYARIAYLQMLKDIKPSSDVVIDGSLAIEEIVKQIVETI